jgi:hypothetical protein
MNLYRIIGLNVTNKIGNSYKTKNPLSNQILLDETGKGIKKDYAFRNYIVYIEFENAYYAIHLSESHRASFGGKLCTQGHISINSSNYEEVMKNITHFSLIPIDIEFKLNEYYEDDICVCINNNPDTCVFRLSNNGNNERTPLGFVYVNMDLFIQK